jgi:hypothetical protein
MKHARFTCYLSASWRAARTTTIIHSFYTIATVHISPMHEAKVQRTWKYDMVDIKDKIF